MTLLVGSIFHMTRKIVSEMTYNVSMGTLNPTIPYHTVAVCCELLMTDFDSRHVAAFAAFTIVTGEMSRI